VNVVALFVYFAPKYFTNSGNVTNPTVTPNVVSNQTSQNISNQTSNMSIYQTNCINSIDRYVKTVENISNTSFIETKVFDKNSNVTNYLQRNWSSSFYEIDGVKKDIRNITVLSVVDVKTNRGRNFIIPLLCDESGNIGKYSSCLLDNVPNIPSACYNLTVNITECETELSEHTMWDDIEYWFSPLGGSISIPITGPINKTVKFNFTISSSRKRLESFGMSVIYRTFSPLTDNLLYKGTKFATDGKGGSLTTTVNLTDKAGGEIYATIWFKKRCYDKYVIY
jgi:hypothetical protein